MIGAALVLVAGPLSHLYLHHQPMPRWFNQAVAVTQFLLMCWFAVTRWGCYLPQTPFDQVCEVYLRLWQE